MEPEPFLTLHPYHLSREKAREYVLALVGRVGGERPRNIDWKNGFVDITCGSVTKRFMFAAMESEARRAGVVEVVQRLLDGTDGVFGGSTRDCTFR